MIVGADNEEIKEMRKTTSRDQGREVEEETEDRGEAEQESIPEEIR